MKYLLSGILTLFIVVQIAPAATYLVSTDALARDDIAELPVIKWLNNDHFLLVAEQKDMQYLDNKGIEYRILDDDPEDNVYFLVFLLGENEATIAQYGTILETYGDCVLLKTTEDVIPILNTFKVELNRVFLKPLNISESTQKHFLNKPLRYNPRIQEMVDAVLQDSVQSYILRMQRMYTRYCTSDSNKYTAVPWIRDKLIAYGCDSVYTESFSGTYGPNIIGIKWGEVYPDTYCVIVGHMDDVPSSGYAPGADDNASGTSAAIEAARVLNDYEFEYTIKYILVNAEEVGLIGSDYYATNAAAQGHEILGVVNYDMIGYTETLERLDAHYTTAIPGCSLFVVEFFQAVADSYTQLWIRPRRNTGTSGYSDHASFWQNGYIALCGIENPLCPGYHTIGDTIGPYGVNNLPFATKVVKTGVAAIAEMAVPIDATGPYISLSRTEVVGGNGNGRLDPGESAGIVCYVINVGDSAATNTSAILRTSDSYITITDSTTNYGTIQPGDSANNSADPFDVSVSAACPEGHSVDFELYVACAETTWIKNFTLIVGIPGLDFVTHDCGNVKLSVTRYGAVGFMGSSQAGGEGFCYPISSSNHLYYGGFTVGTDASYVVDRYKEYNGNDDTDWSTTTIPDGMVRMSEPGPGTFDEFATARYDDSGHSLTKDLICEQYSFAWDDATANDFVIMQFILRNEGSSTIDDLYAGLFMDWDIGTYNNNEGSSEQQRRLTWMYETTPYVGVSILDPDSLTPATNLALIDNPVYVHPNDGLADSDQIKFMDATIQNTASDRPEDWTTCNSMGPFTLAPNDSQIVAFAILGGNNLSDLQINADTAYVRYWGLYPGIRELEQKLINSWVSVLPAISRSGLYKVQYDLPQEALLHLKIYNAAGRVVYDKEYGTLTGTGEVSFDLRTCAQGVYFVKIEAGNIENVSKIIVLR